MKVSFLILVVSSDYEIESDGKKYSIVTEIHTLFGCRVMPVKDGEKV